MTYDEVKRKLKDYQTCVKRKESLERQYEMYRQNCIALGIDYSQPNVLTSAKPDAPYVRWIIECRDVGEELKEERIKMMRAMKEARGLISYVSDLKGRTILELLYIEGDPVYRVAHEFHYTEENVRRIRWNAINEIVKACNEKSGVT